jgi:hypothetical protein
MGRFETSRLRSKPPTLHLRADDKSKGVSPLIARPQPNGVLDAAHRRDKESSMTHSYRLYDPLNQETIHSPWRTLSALDGVFGCAKLYVTARLPDGAKVRLTHWPGDPRARRLDIESSDESRVEPALLHYVKIARLSFERV